MGLFVFIVIFAEAINAYDGYYWRKNYGKRVNCSWYIWINRYGQYRLWFDARGVSLATKQFSLSFRYEIFRWHFISPFRAIKLRRMPLMFKLQSFCTPKSGWAGAKWRIMYGPFDLIVNRKHSPSVAM